jgi:putative acyl-CoA dehydrogenase
VAACVDHQDAREDEALLKRLLTPVAKYWVCKRTPPVVAEAMEAIGGNGYVEDGPMPRLFRQSPLNSIWEGAGNIMCLDVLRVLAREPRAGAVLMAELEGARGRLASYDGALDALEAQLGAAAEASDARRLTERIALAMSAARLLHDGTTPVAEAFCRHRLANGPGGAFGTLPTATDFATLIERAGP